MNLDHLRTYALVMQSGSFSAAAEKLGLSQPAVSQQMQQLERQLKLRLIERVGRRARPTPAGADLLEQIRHVDAAVDGLMTAMSSHTREVKGRITLGTGATACLYFLPQALRTLRDRFPNLGVVVKTGNTGDFVRAVQENTLDMALVTLPVRSRALEVMELLDDEFVAVAPRRGAALPQRVTPASLAGRPLILFEPAANTRTLIDEWFRAGGPLPRPVMELGSVEAIKGMVAAGLGYSILPSMAVRGAGAHAQLQASSLTPRLRRRLAVILRKDKPVSKALRQVIEALQQQAAAR